MPERLPEGVWPGEPVSVSKCNLDGRADRSDPVCLSFVKRGHFGMPPSTLHAPGFQRSIILPHSRGFVQLHFQSVNHCLASFLQYEIYSQTCSTALTQHSAGLG